MSRYIIDGYNDDEDEYVHRFILSKENPNYDFSMRENELEEGEVYAIDILMSTGIAVVSIITYFLPFLWMFDVTLKTFLKKVFMQSLSIFEMYL